MKQVFTTGELAKLCNVSVRTVQYYDNENILCPSEISEGGRRIYSQEDLKKLRCICLYKALGFSLEEIKKITENSNTLDFLSETISTKQSKLTEQIQILNEKSEKLSAIKHQIDETGTIKVESIEELDDLLVRKKQHRKTDIMTYIFLGCYILILCAGFPLAASAGVTFTAIMCILSVLILLGLIYYHSQVNAYVCPKCCSKFTIGFFKDMFSLNGAKKGKYLKCPFCGHHGWFSETFPD